MVPLRSLISVCSLSLSSTTAETHRDYFSCTTLEEIIFIIVSCMTICHVFFLCASQIKLCIIDNQQNLRENKWKMICVQICTELKFGFLTNIFTIRVCFCFFKSLFLCKIYVWIDTKTLFQCHQDMFMSWQSPYCTVTVFRRYFCAPNLPVSNDATVVIIAWVAQIVTDISQ